jgi:hypothetical protein
MILLKSSSDFTWPWSGKDESEAEKIFEATYPSLFQRMKRYEDYNDPKTGKKRGLRLREDQGRYWWELRPCAYYGLFASPKIIYQAIQFYARYTFEEQEVYGNNKTYFFGADNLAVLGILNSPLMWWYSWRHFIHMKDEALSNDQVKIAELPIATKLLEDELFKTTVSDLLRVVNRVSAADVSLQDWLYQGFDIKRGHVALRKMSALSFDDFIKSVKSGLARGRKLTAAEVSDLKREYDVTISPVLAARIEIDTFERSISDTVNAAYGLSEADVALLWDSAPPRMPFTPAGLNEGSIDEMHNDEEEDTQDGNS